MRWIPPPQNCFKANWDVALCADKKWMGIGVIVRDFMGFVCPAFSQTRVVCAEAVIAESMGVLSATEFCRDLGLQEVISKVKQKWWLMLSMIVSPSGVVTNKSLTI